MSEIRPIQELQTVTDCVEEILFVLTHHAAVLGLIRTDPRDTEHPGDVIYSSVEAIVRRAQELPHEADVGSSPQTAEQPAQPV